MADRRRVAGRLPYRWVAGDPEPDERVATVRTTSGETWVRIAPQGPGYHWWNGDNTRWWDALTHNRGPIHNVARLSRMHTMYGRRRRA